MEACPQDAHHPAGLHSAALVAFDGKVRACLESIGCFPVSDRIWHQATLGVKHGGLGFRQCAVHATAAYLASVATTPEACRGLDGRYNPDWPTSSATAAAYNAVVLEADRFRGDQAHRQQAISAVLDKAQLGAADGDCRGRQWPSPPSTTPAAGSGGMAVGPPISAPWP